MGEPISCKVLIIRHLLTGFGHAACSIFLHVVYPAKPLLYSKDLGDDTSDVSSVSDSETNELELFSHLERKDIKVLPPNDKAEHSEARRRSNISTRAPRLNFRTLINKTAETPIETRKTALTSLQPPTSSRPTRKLTDLKKISEVLTNTSTKRVASSKDIFLTPVSIKVDRSESFKVHSNLLLETVKAKVHRPHTVKSISSEIERLDRQIEEKHQLIEKLIDRLKAVEEEDLSLNHYFITIVKAKLMGFDEVESEDEDPTASTLDCFKRSCPAANIDESF